jgi:hypothetical protein
MPVRQERTGWRDRALSERHRGWGRDCPAIDIDFLEFHRGEPVALIECKHEFAPPWNLDGRPARAFIRLAERAGLPAFYVVRADDFSWWQVQALNDIAADWLGTSWLSLTEAEFISLLYALRGINMPPDLAGANFCMRREAGR